MKTKENGGNIPNKKVSIDVARKTILALLEFTEWGKVPHYSHADTLNAKSIINIYVHFIGRSNYQVVIEDYKNKFIRNEAIVEPGVTPGERAGLGLIYDYISSFDFEHKEPNVFIDAMRLHCLLYSQTKVPEFGGKLRQTTAVLNDIAYDVPPADVAAREFQSYITKKFDVDIDDIFTYINESIKVAVDCIKLQPFADGNKRVFRAFLNLQLARIGIPPVYVKQSERAAYKKALEKAIVEGNYESITTFYYHKMCEAIVELDLMKSQQVTDKDAKRFVILPKQDNK